MIATPRISSFLSSFDDCRLQVAVLIRTLIILYRISATGTSFSDHSREMAALKSDHIDIKWVVFLLLQ